MNPEFERLQTAHNKCVLLFLVIKSKKYLQLLPFLKMNYKLTPVCVRCILSRCCSSLAVIIITYNFYIFWYLPMSKNQEILINYHLKWRKTVYSHNWGVETGDLRCFCLKNEIKDSLQLLPIKSRLVNQLIRC